MKYIISTLVLVFGTTTYAKPTTTRTTMENSNLKQINTVCPNAIEVYKLPKPLYSPSPYISLLRFEKCMNHNNVLAVIWFGEAKELEKTFAKLVALNYKENFQKKERSILSLIL